jgi:hypothetical protein
MKTPVKSSFIEFAQQRSEWIDLHCVTRGESQLCVKCGTRVEYIGAFLSVHDASFDSGCAGPGGVVRLVVPFCPQCEERPALAGCIHEHIGEMMKPLMEWRINAHLLTELLREIDLPVLNGGYMYNARDVRAWLHAKVKEMEKLASFFSS